jgi:hypothetical protein
MQEAQDIVENWLMLSKGPISDEMGENILEIVHYHGGIHGEPGYYIAFLEPNGWVAVPADDSLKAIIAFGQGSFPREEYAHSPLATFLQINVDYDDQNLYSAYSTNNQTQTSSNQIISSSLKIESAQNNARAKRWQILSTPSTTSEGNIKPMSWLNNTFK